MTQIAFNTKLRDEFASNAMPGLQNTVIVPRGNAYAQEALVTAHEAEAYHSKQI